MNTKAWLDTTFAYMHTSVWDLWLDRPPVKLF